MSRIALIDMDGTIANYDSAMVRDMKAIRSPHEPEDYIPHASNELHMKARAKMIRSQPGWWENLEPIKAGFEIIEQLKIHKYDLHILTKAPHSVIEAYTGKAKWCQKYLPEADITITHNKSLVYGRILVDDWPPYINGWLEHRPRGLVIMVKQRWNIDFKHPNAIHYYGSNLNEIIDKIKSLDIK